MKKNYYETYVLVIRNVSLYKNKSIYKTESLRLKGGKEQSMKEALYVAYPGEYSDMLKCLFRLNKELLHMNVFRRRR